MGCAFVSVDVYMHVCMYACVYVCMQHENTFSIKFSHVRSYAQIGLVGQEPVLMSGTIEDNILYSVLQEEGVDLHGEFDEAAFDMDASAQRRVRVCWNRLFETANLIM
jgi:hypothetical protein